MTLLVSVFAYTQNIAIPVGKKFGVTMVTQLTTKASALGQEMSLGNSLTSTSDYEVKAVTNNGFTISSTLKHVTGTSSVMGEEQTFDSNDSSSHDDPQYEGLADILNKPIDIEVENKRTTFKGEGSEGFSQVSGIPGMANDQAKFFLTKEDMLKLKEGNQWTDSISTEESKVLYEYTVLKAGGPTAEILVKATIKIDINVKEMGMEIKQSLKGTSNGRRQYNSQTGLLLKEDSDIAIGGKMEVLGQPSPINITGKIITTVTQ